MIRLRNMNGKGWMQPSDLYEWTIGELSKGTYVGVEEDKVLENLRSVEIIINSFKNLAGLNLVIGYQSFLRGMQDGSIPPDPMAWSAIYFEFTNKGLKTNSMRSVINNSPELLLEIKRLMSN
ncbi:hypothetical protein [Lentimicrobium sp. S6]|uniref:hypothetical protein n=1 Tax=Lentimicrobium sp. S6 TaxID=2735872 RepID=UPI0015546853|nr:hypothetical protein [Lentimicrobium sp. S6]NPD47411.1 hypothetical protein [Lentimicrobium sp. S6]